MVVLYIDDSALLVDDFSHGGGFIHGEVINGAWTLKIDKAKKLVYADERVATPYKNLEIVKGVRYNGDYNSTILRADSKPREIII